MTKGTQITIKNETFECYNVTSVYHFIKIGKKGQRLSPKNFENLLNLTPFQIERMSQLNLIAA